MEKTLLAYDVDIGEQTFRKHEWHESQESANRRIKFLRRLNKDNERSVKYKHFNAYTTITTKIKK